MIRKLEKKDYDSFISLMDDFYHSEAVLHPVDRKNYDITFERCITNDPFASCFVYDDGSVKGYIFLSFSYSNEIGGMVVWIEQLYVDKNCRSKGIGSALMNFVHEEYKKSAKRFRLEASYDNENAIRLYKSMGYKDINYLQLCKDI